MATLLSKKNILIWSLFLLWCAALLAAQENSEIDPVLQYYWDGARDRIEQLAGVRQKVGLTFQAITIRQDTDAHGVILDSDTAVTQLYFTGLSLDSQVVIPPSDGKPELEQFDWPPLDWDAYTPNLYPNDTGGPDLAIGFVSDSADERAPDGLLIVDRDQYYPKWLYLYYNDRPNFRRFTRTYRFTIVDGILVADSISDVATRMGIFTDDSYRIETSVSDIIVEHTSAARRPEPAETDER